MSRRPLLLLAGQALALGLTVAWVTIPASAIFLEAYGSGALPATYIGAAVAGAVASAALSRAFRRTSLVRVTFRVLVVLATCLAASFVASRLSGAWVCAGLLMLVPILVPIGFMFVVGQAGMLLDVRTLKVSYARVIAGFASGFVIGGLVSPALLQLFGRADSLLACAAASAAAFAAIVRRTEHAFPTALDVVGEPDTAAQDAAIASAGRPTFRSLLRNRYVVLIMGFQMLSAVESQWLDFLVFDRAAQRYHSSVALADFISRFTAIAYGADILFLLVVAGLLLRRFGLRYGLTANAAVVLSLLVATVACTLVSGSFATVVFALVVATRVSDLALSDGSSRTSLSAAYQAVPTAERLAAQSVVEGLAVPVAIGASGVVLMVVRATVGTDGLALTVMTIVVVLAWLLCAAFVFRDYRVNLLHNLRYRTLDPTTLAIDDLNTLDAVHRLIGSDHEADVRLGIHALTVNQHPDLVATLHDLADDGRDGVRVHALATLASVDPSSATRMARRGLADPSAVVRGTCLDVLARAGEPDDVALVLGHWGDDDPDVRVAAAAAVSRLGDGTARALVSREVAALAASADPHDAVVAARVLERCSPASGIDRAPLRQLLAHTDGRVVAAALRAVQWPEDGELVAVVVAHLADRRTARSAVDALGRGGAAVLDLADLALDGGCGMEPGTLVQLPRVCRSIGGDRAAEVLGRHLGHADREVGLAVARALGELTSAVPARGPAEQVPALDVMMQADLADAARLLAAETLFADVDAFASLAMALRDELALRRDRLLAALGVRHGIDAVDRVAFQLVQPDPRARAVALEWLDVTLTGTERAVIALLEPELSTEARLGSLGHRLSMGQAARDAVLRDLIEDVDDRWRRPYLSACALLAAVNSDTESVALPAIARVDSLEDAAPAPDLVAETLAGLRKRVSAR